MLQTIGMSEKFKKYNLLFGLKGAIGDGFKRLLQTGCSLCLITYDANRELVRDQGHNF